MRSLRGRLAAWYAVALAATMFVFATVVFLVQRRENYDELDNRVRSEADLIAVSLGEAYLARGNLVVTDPSTHRPTLNQDVTAFLQGIPGYILVVGGDGNLLASSADARAMPSYGSLLKILGPALEQHVSGEFGVVDVGSPVGPVRYYVRPIDGAGPRVQAVLTGASIAGISLTPKRLLAAMLLVAPIILFASTLVGYALVGRTLEPVDRIVDEVEAITDGRSLHRRLAVLDAGGELARLSTTLNAMMGRLERSFSTLRRFTADASHELKTPLTVLRAGIERAITHPKTPPELLEVLDETLGEVHRMTEMVDALLMLARADEGRAPLHLEQVDLTELVTDIGETANILGEQAGVNVAVRAPAEPLEVAADPARIRQLLMNLMTNAIKYTPRGGAVRIELARQAANVVLVVRDTGIGIAPGDLPHIFDRFWRADEARSRTGERPGTGLGLAISKWIAEAHGGEIDVQSRPARGTTFTVTLPAAVA